MNLPKYQKLYSVKYCYRNWYTNTRNQFYNKVISYGKKLSLWLPIATGITILHSSQTEGLTIIMAIMLIIVSLKNLLLDSFTNNINLNQIETYLNNITNVIQVISLELYHLTPKVRVLRIYINVKTTDITLCSCLQEKIKSELWKQFGITQTLIQMTSEISNPAQFYTNNNLSELETIEIKNEPYSNLTKQSYIELN